MSIALILRIAKPIVMFRPKILLLFFLIILSITWLNSTGIWSYKTVRSIKLNDDAPASSTLIKLSGRAVEAKKFIGEKGFNSSFCFLIDMSISSGQNRFFVYDLKNDSILKSGLVTHGRCNENWLEGRKYGNTIGCGCTSLGKYRIGNNYNGRFGLAYKLFGLEKTNDKAFSRYVVLHSHSCVPEKELNEDICQSDGCPIVSRDFLQYLAPLLNDSLKPVLLWIFE